MVERKRGRKPRPLTLDHELLAAVDAFAAKWGWKDRAIGLAAEGNARMLWDYRRGTMPETPTRERIFAWLAAKDAELTAATEREDAA